MKTSRKSGASSKKKVAARNRKASPSVPFDRKVWNEARELANQYKWVLERSRPGRYECWALEMPSVFDHGRTPGEAVENLRKSLTLAIATLLEHGQRPPLPARSGRRTRQVNLRVSELEKLLLEQSAQRRGFRGVSDFVRNAALAEACRG